MMADMDKNSELEMKILTSFYDKYPTEYLIYNGEAGRTFENFMTAEKVKAFREGIRETIDYLERRHEAIGK